MNLLVVVVGLALIGAGLLGFGGRGNVDLGDFGKYSGPAGLVIGLAFLVVGSILP